MPAKPLFLFPAAETTVEIEIGSRSTRKFHGDIKALVQSLKSDVQSQFVFQTHGLAERFAEILRDYDVELPEQTIRVGDLSGGFEIPSLDLTVFTETDIFGETTQAEYQRSKIKDQRSKTKIGAFISDFRDLKTGDFVVHVDHGIGRFEGLQTITSQNSEREFMLLVYAENTKLFVPVERLDLVSRYSSGEGAPPTLDRLGGIGWQENEGEGETRDARYGGRAFAALRRTQTRAGFRVFGGRAVAEGI